MAKSNANTKSTTNFEEIFLAIFEKIKYFVLIIFDFISPILLGLMERCKKSIDSTDFNTWNPKSFMWTLVVILRLDGIILF